MFARSSTAIVVAGLLTVVSSRTSIADARSSESGAASARPDEQPRGAGACTRETAVAATEVLLGASGFSPSCILVERGESVLFSNADGRNHTVTSDPGRPDSSTKLDSGVIATEAGYPYTFLERGEFGVHCLFHRDHATIIVE